MRQLKLQRTKKVVNVKEENEIRTLQIKRACKKYEDIMDECPDEYVNKISRQISFLYYFAKYMNSNKRMIRENLEKIDFNPFVNIYMTSNINELYDKSILKRMHTTCIMLLELLVILKVENDERIKLDFSLNSLRNEIDLNSNFVSLLAKEENPIFKFKRVKRMFALKDGVVIENCKKIEKDKSLKGSVIFIEYEGGKYIGIPYKNYKKLLDIEKIELTFYAIEDTINEGLPHCYEDRKIEDVEYIDYNKLYIESEGLFNIIQKFTWYREIREGFEVINRMTSKGYYCGNEKIKVTFKDYSKHKYTYKEFLETYFPFLIGS